VRPTIAPEVRGPSFSHCAADPHHNDKDGFLGKEKDEGWSIHLLKFPTFSGIRLPLRGKTRRVKLRFHPEEDYISAHIRVAMGCDFSVESSRGEKGGKGVDPSARKIRCLRLDLEHLQLTVQSTTIILARALEVTVHLPHVNHQVSHM
jgi:hypothetical protein